MEIQKSMEIGYRQSVNDMPHSLVLNDVMKTACKGSYELFLQENERKLKISADVWFSSLYTNPEDICASKRQRSDCYTGMGGGAMAVNLRQRSEVLRYKLDNDTHHSIAISLMLLEVQTLLVLHNSGRLRLIHRFQMNSTLGGQLHVLSYQQERAHISDNVLRVTLMLSTAARLDVTQTQYSSMCRLPFSPRQAAVSCVQFSPLTR